MKNPSESNKELASKIREHLGKGKLDAALELFSDTFLKNEALKLDARLERWKARRAKGTRRSEDELVEENQLIEALMSLVERLEQGEDQPQKKMGDWLKENIKLLGAGIVSLAAVFTALGVIFNFFGTWLPGDSGPDCEGNEEYEYQIGLGYFKPVGEEQDFSTSLNQELSKSDLIKYAYKPAIIPVKTYVALPSRNDPRQEKEILAQANAVCVQKGLLAYGNYLSDNKSINCRIKILDMKPPVIDVVPKGTQLEVLEDYVFYARTDTLSFNMQEEAQLLGKLIIGLMAFYVGDSTQADQVLTEVAESASQQVDQEELFHTALEYLFLEKLKKRDIQGARVVMEKIPAIILETPEMQRNLACLATLERKPEEAKAHLTKLVSLLGKDLSKPMQIEVRALMLVNAYTVEELGGEVRTFLDSSAVDFSTKEKDNIIEAEERFSVNEKNRLAKLKPKPKPVPPKDPEPTPPPKESTQLPQMILVKGGSFQMGSEEIYDAKPIHEVRVSDFYLAQTEVTNAQFTAFLNAKGNLKDDGVTWYNPDGAGYGGQAEAAIYQESGGLWKVREGKENLPVNYVSWYGARAYCNWLGTGYRLPTEAEWEYAAGGGASARTQYAGTHEGGELRSYGNYDGVGGKDQYEGLAPVGTFLSNALGFHDLSGNVWEWCADWYDADYYTGSPPSNPQGPASGSLRVVRGGSWLYDASRLRVAYRGVWNPGGRNRRVGFRPARTP